MEFTAWVGLWACVEIASIVMIRIAVRIIVIVWLENIFIVVFFGVVVVGVATRIVVSIRMRGVRFVCLDVVWWGVRDEA